MAASMRMESGPGRRRFRAPGFSLVELVIVVTILGIIASIAIPRMTTATSTATSNALEATLANVRKAVDMYFAEHGKYPGYDPGSSLPDNDLFRDQLLMYTDAAGKTSATPTGRYFYGPYLRSPFPRNPFNNLDTVYVKATPTDPDPADDSFGWAAVLSHGYFGISANDTVLDDAGFDEEDVRVKLRDVGLGK